MMNTINSGLIKDGQNVFTGTYFDKTVLMV